MGKSGGRWGTRPTSVNASERSHNSKVAFTCVLDDVFPAPARALLFVWPVQVGLVVNPVVPSLARLSLASHLSPT